MIDKLLDIEELKNDSKRKYISYVQKLSLDEIIINQLTDIDFIEKNPSFYIFYPKLFSHAFDIDNNILEKLCIAGYLYYISVLKIDRLIDDKDISELALISIAQEESIKLLTEIFGINSHFWSYWNTRRSEYYEAVLIEKKLMSQKKHIDIEIYSKLADFKSAFGKIAIDVMFCLSKKSDKSKYKKLLESHHFFSTAFQINDDILDFNEDFSKGQFNWAIHMMKAKGESFDDPKRAKKIFYLNGYGKELFELAIEYIDRALIKTSDIDIPYWKKELSNLKNKFNSSIIETENYIETLKSSVNQSKIKYQNNNIEHAIPNAIKYIANLQNQNGSWREYQNQGGISDVWATTFITSKLNEYKNEFNLSVIKKALKFIRASKKNNLWSYNSTWIDDADSTTLAMLAFSLYGENIPEETFRLWKKFKTFDGGFSTYNNSDRLIKNLTDGKIKNVDGWISTHQCVSAVCFYLAVITKQKDITDDLLKYFDKIICSNKINSYWWSSPIYTLHFLAKAYYLLNNNRNKIEHILNEIVSFPKPSRSV